MMTPRQLGREFTKGVIDVVFSIIILGVALSWLINFFTPLDDCDTSIWDRCGLEVVVDAKTGTEYLVTSSGHIIRREP